MDQNILLKNLHRPDFSVENLKEFCVKYPNVNLSRLKYSKTGDTILHICARLGHVNIIKYIFNFGLITEIDLKNNDCKTPLHEAAQFAQFEAVKTLLTLGSVVNAIKRADWTPLMLACTKTGENAYKIIKLLLEKGALVNLKNKDGWMAIHIACREGDEKIVNLLLGHYTDLSKLKTKNGRTVLHIAALHGHYNVVEILLKYFDPSITDKCGNTILHEATFNGSLKLINLLLSEDYNLHAVNNAGLSVLHMAAGEGMSNLVSHFVMSLNMDINLKSYAGWTPLHCAARQKQVETMQVLVELGADISVKDFNYRVAADYLVL